MTAVIRDPPLLLAMVHPQQYVNVRRLRVIIVSLSGPISLYNFSRMSLILYGLVLQLLDKEVENHGSARALK